MSIISEKLPPGWRAAKLGEIVTLNPSRSKKLRDDDIVSFLSMPDVSEEGRVLNKQSRTFASVRNGFTTFENGDVLVAKITPCFENGKGALVDELENGVGFGSTEFHVVRALDPEDRLFVQLHTSSKQFRLLGENMMTGSAGHKRVPADFIRGYKIPLPPPEQRHRITGLLNTWDDAIHLQTQLLEDLRKRQRALAQKLLSCDIRLPEFKEKWSEKSFGELLREVRRPVKWDDDEDYSLLSVRRRSGGVFYRQTLKGAAILTKNLLTAHAGDFLISKMQIVHGASGLVPPELDGMKVSGSYIVAVPRNPAELWMPYFALVSAQPEFYDLCLKSSYGVHIEKMTFNFVDFSRRKMKLPPLPEQQAIADVLNTGAAEICLRQTELIDLREQKRGLMQQLLTGQALLH